MILTELHPADVAALKDEFAGDRQVAVHHLDAYQGLKAFLPPKERRGMVLIDPAYELRDEGERAVAALIAAWRRWPQGVFALRYPVTHRALADHVQQKVIKAGVKKSLAAEINVRPPTNAQRLNGSGMLIVNPPRVTEDVLTQLSGWLGDSLAMDAAGHRLAWLVADYRDRSDDVIAILTHTCISRK